MSLCCLSCCFYSALISFNGNLWRQVFSRASGQRSLYTTYIVLHIAGNNKVAPTNSSSVSTNKNKNKKASSLPFPKDGIRLSSLQEFYHDQSSALATLPLQTKSHTCRHIISSRCLWT